MYIVHIVRTAIEHCYLVDINLTPVLSSFVKICHLLENPQRIQTVDHPQLLIFLSFIQNYGNERVSSEVHIGFSNTASNGVSSVIGPESNHWLPRPRPMIVVTLYT